MKKVILLLCSIMLSVNLAFADSCFIAKENGKVLQSEGDCDTSYSPCSSFKITLALMGYDAGILKDEMNPEWPFKKGYDDFRDTWKQDQTPKSWMKESCVWYSQVLTTKLGIKKFQDYVTKFGYGNKDLAGDKGKNNGLTNAWLSSSLEISSLEQVAFLEKMLAGTLPIKPYAIEMTKNILFLEELKNGWKLYGKTGSGYLLNEDRTQKLEIKHGWFIGWIVKGDKKIIFVNHIVDNKIEEKHAGPRAKANVKERIIKIIDQIEGNK
jgi:beta-lactamase class D